jgi:hypothetical protein
MAPYIVGATEAVVPQSLSDLVHMAILPRAEPIDVERENQLGAEWRGEYGPEAQARSVTGTAMAGLPLLHLPFSESPLRPTPADISLVDQINLAQAQAAQPPPIPPEYAERRFTMQDTPPEPPPQLAPAPPIEQTLGNIGQPLPFNPELGPQPQAPDFQMPLQTDMAQSPNAQPLFPTPPPGTPLKGTPLVGPNGSTPAADAASASQVPPPVSIPPGDERYAGVTPQVASPEGNPPGIANRYVEEQIYRGELPPEAMATGTGTTARAAAEEARARLAQDPNLAFQAARRIRNGSVQGGDTAILHAYNDQLAEGAAQARQASFANPGDPTLKAAADAAEKAHVQFLQDVKPLAGGLAQRIMVGFQGAYPPDLSTYAGMYKEMTQLNEGRPVPPEIRSNLYRRAQKAQKAAQAEKAAVDKLQQAMDKNLPKRPVPTKEQMASRMEEFKRKVAPCP